jgi:hypothetical protein
MMMMMMMMMMMARKMATMYLSHLGGGRRRKPGRRGKEEGEVGETQRRVNTARSLIKQTQGRPLQLVSKLLQ